MRLKKTIIPPLILEQLIDGPNLKFLSIIEFKRKHYLCIIDDIKQNYVTAYLIEQAESEGIDLQQLMSVVVKWYYFHSEEFPISIMFTKEGLKSLTERIFKRFNKTYVGRIVGAPFYYGVQHLPKTKKRRVIKRKELTSINLGLINFCGKSTITG